MQINNVKSLPFRGALLASGAMAFAGLGDAFLYPVLPIFGSDMGLSVFVIGLLLSVNRFVRILANTHMANVVNSIGMKKVLIICSTLAVLTTFLYGLNTGLIIFFFARIVWGLCYSGLKIATLNYAAQVEKKSGMAFGITHSIKSLGALFVLWLGPIIVKEVGIETGILSIAFISGIGIIFAFSLPALEFKPSPHKIKTNITFYPNAMNLLVFMLSTSIDGILVVTLSILFGESHTDLISLLAMVAFYLLLKRFFAVGLSLISGFLTLRIAPIILFLIAISICILALILIATEQVVVGVTLAFLFNTVIVTFSPLIAISKPSTNNSTLQAISGVSTWWDLGAGLGTCLGIFLIEFLGSYYLFLALSSITLVLFINFIRQYGNTNSRIV